MAKEYWEAATLAQIACGLQRGAVGAIGVDWPGGGGHAITVVDLYPEKRTVPAGWWQFRIGDMSGMQGKYGGYLLRTPCTAPCDQFAAPVLA